MNVAPTQNAAQNKIDKKKGELNNKIANYEKGCGGSRASSSTCKTQMSNITTLENEINYLNGVKTVGKGDVFNSEKISKNTKPKPQPQKPKQKPVEVTTNTKKTYTESDIEKEMLNKGYTRDQYTMEKDKNGNIKVTLGFWEQLPDTPSFGNSNVNVSTKALDISLGVADKYLFADKVSVTFTQGHLTDTFGPILSGKMINKFGPGSGWGSPKEIDESTSKIGIEERYNNAKAIVNDKNTFEINENKFKYIFGEVESSSHNKSRSRQLTTEMKKVGLRNDELSANILKEHYNEVVKGDNVIRSYSDKYGNFEVRESLLLGPNGKAVKLETTFKIDDGKRVFSTVIPKN